MMTHIRLFSLILLWIHNAASAKQISIYTEILPPYQLMEGAEVSGSATKKVQHLLESAKLSYEINVVPWARAFNVVKTTPNTLIYSMNRNPEREPYFHWITVVGIIDNGFISLKSNNLNITQLHNAKAYVTAVVRNGYAHGILLQQGFKDNQDMYVVATLEQQISLLLKGKVDFVFTDIQSVKYALNQLSLDPAIVRMNYTEPAWTRDLYLAANIDTDTEIVTQITAILANMPP